MQSERPTILAPARYFIPAYKAGGPARTLEAMTWWLGGEFRFKILTSSHDLGESAPFKNIRVNDWNRVGAVEVMYLSPDRTGPAGIIRAIRQTDYDILYLNSFFDPDFTIAPLLARRLGMLSGKPVILAPRGELAPAVMAHKWPKKAMYLSAARLLALYRNVLWHASAELESDEIALAFNRYWGMKRGAIPIHIARNLAHLDEPADFSGQPKIPGRLRAVFISRLAPKKNLLSAIEFLSRVRGEVSLDIYGAVDDPGYWEQCQALIGRCAGTPRVEVKGAIRHQEVLTVLAGYDVFIFPTLGENFGHVILESLLAGCPVVTSDRTPWRNLQAKSAGWNLPLDAPARYVEVLQRLADWGETEYGGLRAGARALARNVLKDGRAIEDNRRLFERTMAPGGIRDERGGKVQGSGSADHCFEPSTFTPADRSRY